MGLSAAHMVLTTFQDTASLNSAKNTVIITPNLLLLDRIAADVSFEILFKKTPTRSKQK